MPKDNINFIFFSDTHLGFDYPIKPKIEKRRRGQDFFNNYYRILDYILDKQADFVIHGGDFFFRSKVPAHITDLAYRALLDFSRSAIPFFIVPGNHERSTLPRSLFYTNSNIFIFDKAKTFWLDIDNVKVAISGFPFVKDNIRDNFNPVLKKTGWQDQQGDIQLLCMHQTIEGVQVGPGDYTFRNGEDVIKMKDIPAGFNAVLSGHIHRQQILRKSFNDKHESVDILYPGSIERTSFAEKEEQKGFYDIRFHLDSDKKWQLSKLKFVKLPARPMIDLYLDNNITKDNMKAFLLSEVQKMTPNAIVKIRCHGKPDQQIKRMIKTSFLKNIFPETMNYQISSDFYIY